MLFDRSEFIPLDPSQEPIFPPKLKVDKVIIKVIAINSSLLVDLFC